MFCINCGKPVDDGSRFCPYCGTKLIPDAPAPEVPAAPAEEAPEAAPAPVAEPAPAEEPAPVSAPVPERGGNTDDFDTADLKGRGGAAPGGGSPYAAPGGGSPYAAPQTPPTRYSDPWSAAAPQGGYPADDSWAGGPVVPVPGKKKHTGRTVGIVVGAVVLVAVAVFAVLYAIGSGEIKAQEAVVESYLSYAESGNTSRIKALFYPAVVEDYEEMYVADRVIEVLDSWTGYYGEAVESYEITDMEPQDNYRDTFNSVYNADADTYEDVTVRVTYESGDYIIIDFDMVRVDGSWYLADIW